jgi:hypothetical protein
LETDQDIETRFIIKITETDITATIETLMDEVECWAGTRVRGPSSLLGSDRQPIDCFQIERNEVGNLSKCKFSVWAERNFAAKNRAYLRMHPEEEKLRIKRRARPNADVPPPDLSFDVAFLFGDGRWRRCLLGCLPRLRCGRSSKFCHSSCKPHS